MSSVSNLKVAIVGAGAAGLYLAWRLSQLGHKVTIFERKNGIEAKACSALVSERVLQLIPGLKPVIENHIRYCRINFKRKTVTLEFHPAFFCLPRQTLDEILAEFAVLVGAEIKFCRTFNGQNQLADLAKDFDRIIGCDGASSGVRRTLGLPEPLMRLGIQTFIKEDDFSDLVETWPVSGGFCWRIPRGKSVEYGIMAPPKEAWHTFKGFGRFCAIDMRSAKILSAPIPQGLILPESESITLCGDAAGLTKPWSGGGLLWSFAAADILVKNFPDFEMYRKEALRFFGPKIRKGKLAVSMVNFFGNNIPGILPRAITIDNDFLPFYVPKG